MNAGLKSYLAKLLVAAEPAWADKMAFYAVAMVASVIWFAELMAQPLSAFFYLSFSTNIALCSYSLYRLWRQRDSATGEDEWQQHAPMMLSLLWLGLVWTPVELASESIFIFMLLSVMLLLSILPFGIRMSFGFSLPVLLAGNYVVTQGPWEDSLRISMLLNLAFLGFWFGALRINLTPGPIGEQRRDMEPLLRELAQSRTAFQEANHSRVELEARVAQKERDLELEIQDRTKAMRDANKQLNQQIALRKTISDALVKSQTRLTQAIDAARLGLIDWDVASSQFYQSSFHSIFGEKEQTSDQVVVALKRIVHPDDYPSVRDTINACLSGEQLEYQLQYRVKDEDAWLWIEECGKVVDLDAHNNAARILGTRRNIQAEMMRDEQVRLAKSVFDHTSEGVFVLDPNGHFLSVNPAFCQINGRGSEELVGQHIQNVSGTPEKDSVYNQILEEATEQGKWQGELLEKRYRGDYFQQWMQLNAVYDDRKNLKYYAGMVSDVSDRKAADEKLQYLINYDDLTKLANRFQFKDQLYRALLRYKDQKIPFALVLLDVDRFSRFNDSFGHDSADSLLVNAAQRLSKSVQKVDILARVGGNEFACIVACSPTFSVNKFAERLFHSVTDGHYEIEGREVILSCSVGVAHVPDDAEDLETLMQYASLAVQKAKYNGGNQIQYFDTALLSFSRERLELEQELRKAISNNELEVFYQPKLNLSENRISSLEALVRWDHPSKGRISPEEFVTIAEENGLISELGEYVLETACGQVQEWSAKGLGDLSIAVNVSPRQLREDGLQEVISRTLKSSGIAPHRLELELTESDIVDDFKGTVLLLKALREEGVKISVDDFGTGYSSLSYLKELPVDTLKIDRTFIHGLEQSKEQQAIVKAIIVLGQSLNLKIVAEGVENEKQLSVLNEYGCDFIQGYLVSKPVNVADMEHLLEKQVAH